MFDLDLEKIMVIIIVAVVVIGPKDLPRALRAAGRWIGKARRVSGHFRAGLENMIREAELEEMEKKWREQNEAIMRAHPAPEASAEPAASIEPAAALAQPLPPPVADQPLGQHAASASREVPDGQPAEAAPVAPVPPPAP